MIILSQLISGFKKIFGGETKPVQMMNNNDLSLTYAVEYEKLKKKSNKSFK